MKIKQVLNGLAAILCVFLLAACDIGGNDKINRTDTNNSSPENPAVVKGNNSVPGAPNDSNDANSLLELASVNGSVVNFKKDSCTITPVKYSGSNDNGLAVMDAPGNEDPDTVVTVHYNSDCIFKIVTIRIATGVATYSDADISDIKKQTSLIIYGDWRQKNNINASAVYIARYE